MVKTDRKLSPLVNNYSVHSVIINDSYYNAWSNATAKRMKMISTLIARFRYSNWKKSFLPNVVDHCVLFTLFLAN